MNSEKQSPDKTTLLTPDEVAIQLKVTSEQIRGMIRKGHLAAINIGSGEKRPLYRITDQALQNFLERRRHAGSEVRPKTFKRLPDPPQDFFPDL